MGHGVNLVPVRSVGSDRLFHSRAFVMGYSDCRWGRKFREVKEGLGPGKTIRSAQLAYERGRQFSVVWGDRPFDIALMIAELKRVGPKGSALIT